MIGRLTGTLVELAPPSLCILVGGVGYELDVPMSTLYRLPAVGQNVSLHTHLTIRDDAHVLYGFASIAERNTFRALIRVTGIGARTALALLSGLSVDDLVDAIQNQESGRLIKVPGIGRKTAERLLLELRDKLDAPGLQTAAPAGGAPTPSADNDVLHALQALGYSAQEARKAVAGLDSGLNVAERIRQALKNLART